MPSVLQSPLMARPHSRPTDDERAHTAALRVEAARVLANAISGAPDAAMDLLGRLAWLYTVLGEDHPDVGAVIAAAREARYSWPQVAGACGFDPDDRHQVEMFRQRDRRRRLV